MFKTFAAIFRSPIHVEGPTMPMP